MAVPKRKTTKSRSGKRRSHIKANPKNIIEDKKSGEYIYELIICHGLLGETNPSYKKSNDPSDYMDFKFESMILQ